MNKKQKTLLVLLLLLGGGVTAWAFTKKKDTASLPTQPSLDPNPPSTDFSKEVADAINEGKKEITLSLEEITLQIHKEMKKSNSDYRVILVLLEPVSEEHFGQMITLFGERPYMDKTRSDGVDGNFLPFNEAIPQKLPYWLSMDLPNEAYQTLKEKFPKYL